MRRILLLSAVTLVMVGVLASPAWAQASSLIIHVNSTDDTIDSNLCGFPTCTLREAITVANFAGDDRIVFDLVEGQSATIKLASPLPAITDSAGLTIDGGSKNITVSGDDGVDDRVRVFSVNSGAKLTLNNLTVSNGHADGENPEDEHGGGAANFGGTLTISNSTFSDNDAFTFGGGAYNDGGTLTISNSTFSHNDARSGGGIYNKNSSTTVTNSTFSGNIASDGGGIWNGGTTTLKNTIVANSTVDGTIPESNCAGTITDGGYNLSSDKTCSLSAANNSRSGTFDPSTGEGVKLEPLLGALDDNGGPTKTYALLAGSPAIDKGNSFGAKTDQRGLPRPSNFLDILDATGGDGSDIGAYEEQVPPALSIDDVNSVTEGNSGTTSNATFTVSLSKPSTKSVTVNYSTDGGTATASSDYISSSGTITFVPGETSKTVDVTVNGDDEFEDNETFFVNLSNATNATISDAQGVGTITNDDPPPDTTAPTTTVALNPATPNGDNGWYTSAVKVTVSATDESGGSGVAETRCVLDPASQPTSFDDLPTGCAYTGAGASVSADGQHTLYAASVDARGNKETPLVSKQFKIDKTPPSFSSCRVSPSTLSLPANNHKLVPITATVTLTDPTGGSGLEGAGFTLLSVASNQADSGLASDDVPNDIQGWTDRPDDTSGLLRAERYGKDRIYTLIYKGKDKAGNSATNCTATVAVPKPTKR